VTDAYAGPERRAEKSSDLWTQRFTAWGSMLVTFAIFLLIGYALLVTSRLTDLQAFNGLTETIKAMAMIAVGFWLGSSNSGQKKDDVLASAATKQTETTNAAISALATSVPVAAAITTTHVDAKAGTAETTTEPAKPDQPGS
jgi:hypothetical protein